MKTKALDDKVQVSEKAIVEQTAVAQQKGALKAAEETLDEFKAVGQAKIEALKTEREALPQSLEHERLELAAKNLQIVKGAKKEVEVASKAMKEIGAEINTISESIGEKIMETLDELFNIRRIELHGSLKDLVEKGQPLKARVQGVIAGHEVDFVIDYDIGRVLEFLKALLWKLWDMIKENIENVFDNGVDEGIKGASASSIM